VYVSAQERHELGRSLRATVPRSALANFVTDEHRPDPVALLESQDDLRISELLPIRYERMLSSPFAFFRGAAAIMAADLAGQQRTGLDAQLCGDAHLANFGLFASPERNLVFDINDFDDTLAGPWEWDVKRLAASLAIAARANGFGRSEREDVVRASAQAYRERMRALAAMRELDVWYAHTMIDDALLASLDPKYARAIRRVASKAHSRDHLEALGKLTHRVNGQRRLVSDPPLIVPIDELVGEADARRHEQGMEVLIDEYGRSVEPGRHSLIGRFRYAGMARKVVGVGSVGARAWVVMLLGRDDDDPLLMQVKEAQPSALELYLGTSEYENAGQRVVVGQRMMQANSDTMLGWLHCVGPDGHEGDYYVRQLRDWKGSPNVEAMSPEVLGDYGRSCGHVLARAHARTGDRIAIAGYLGRTDAADIALAQFAEAYADQNDRDYAALRDAAPIH
jgi:uncharacterized protein (DUF2252 family)